MKNNANNQTNVLNAVRGVTQQLKIEYRHKLDIAFSVMTIIPFLIFFYIIGTKLFFINIVIGNVGLILGITLVLAFMGYLYGFSMLSNSLDEITKETEMVKSAYGELRKTQELLVQAEKFKAIGELASGIAHEVRNPLGIILQEVNYLEDDEFTEKEFRHVLEMMKKNIVRADNIINILVDFSRMSKLDIGLVDINLIIENSMLLVKQRVEFKDIEFVKEVTSNLSKVWADTVKIEQVLLNIFLNAVHAMPQGGRLSVRVYAQKSAEIDFLPMLIKSERFAKPEETVVAIEIQDTGIGISKENLRRIFDPFFTTKGPKGGVGLGLTVARNIIEMHKGFIKIDSQEGKGTKVSILLKTAEG